MGIWRGQEEGMVEMREEEMIRLGEQQAGYLNQIKL